ncbi:MAG: sialidase family protein [bacterium]|nr:sialidase family protein [bacterium]
MGKTRLLISSTVLAFLILFQPVHAQFVNTLLSQKPKPRVTKAEMESDSAHYIDKPNTYRDKRTNMVHSVWTEFDKYKSNNAKDSSYIMYSCMKVSSKTWSKAQRISHFAGDCSNSDRTPKSDNPCVGSGGEIYVCWAGPKGLSFQRSLDTGKTWLPEEKIVNNLVNGWDQTVDGLRASGIPRMACVNEGGDFPGRIYITWSCEKNGPKNKDVFLVYSDDQGENWTEPILVTYRPNHKEQFSPGISIQPGSGHVYLSYFDMQNYPTGKLADLYLAVSENGGLKYNYFKLNEYPILLDSSIVSVRGLAFVPRSNDVKAVWGQTNENNMLSIYSARITDSSIVAYVKADSVAEMQVKRSFKFDKKISIDYSLPQEAKVTAILTKPLESGFETLIAKNIPARKGTNNLIIDTKSHGLVKGNYVLTFYYNGRNSFVWITQE